MKWIKLFVIILVIFTFSGCNPLTKSSKSGLQVITDGVASSVYLDEQLIEKAPFINREIKPGEYTLKIQPDDPLLIPHEQKITLRPGLLTVVTWKLAKRPELSGGVVYEMEPIKSNSKSEVSFITIPDGAIISLKGKDKEFSPVIITDVTPGHSEFEVSLPSYESQKHTINAVAGYRMLVSVKLAKVALEDQELKTTPELSTKPIDQLDSNLENLNSTTEAEIATIKNPVISPNPSITPQPSVTPRPTPTNTTETQVLIKPTNFFQNDIEVLRVRDSSGSAGKEIGFALVGKKYPYLEKTEDNWYNINFDGKSGWVSGTYAEIVKPD